MGRNRKEHALKLGDKIGEFTVRVRYPYNEKEAVNKRLKYRLECSCGEMVTLPEYYIMRSHGPRTDCGHNRNTLFTDNKLSYNSYQMMHVRCEDPNHVAYKHYGGRGIRVCDRWHRSLPEYQGFKNFLADLGARPSQSVTLDRYPNKNGNYEPGNVRWATGKQQRANQRSREEVDADLAKTGYKR